MTKKLEALRVPERIRRDWNRAVMRTCEHCDNWHMTVIHTDGSAMCAGCCDAYYTDQLKETLTAALGRIAELEAGRLAVKLPAVVNFDDMDATSQDREVVEAIAQCKGWNAAIEAAQRMNASPLAVKLPTPSMGVVQSGKAVMIPYSGGHWLNKTAVKEAIRAAGGTVEGE